MKVLCDACSHSSVCSYRDKYIDLVMEIDKLVTVKTRLSGENVFDPGLNCTFYTRKIESTPR